MENEEEGEGGAVCLKQACSGAPIRLVRAWPAGWDVRLYYTGPSERRIGRLEGVTPLAEVVDPLAYRDQSHWATAKLQSGAVVVDPFSFSVSRAVGWLCVANGRKPTGGAGHARGTTTPTSGRLAEAKTHRRSAYTTSRSNRSCARTPDWRNVGDKKYWMTATENGTRRASCCSRQEEARFFL